MVTTIKEERTISQTSEVGAEPSPEIREKATQFVENYAGFLQERTEAYVKRLAAPGPKPEIGAPVLAGGYQYWNCLTIGPVQFYGNPPYRPSKIIRQDELTLMLGVVWINPANGPGGSLPGTVVLGGRDYRVVFESINLSDVVNGPDGVFSGTFGNPADVVNLFWWWFTPADPGPEPNLYETTLTADIAQSGQPLAAFSTWHYDIDEEPPFLMVPAAGPHWQFERPARFLVYRE